MNLTGATKILCWPGEAWEQDAQNLDADPGSLDQFEALCIIEHLGH